MVPASHVNTSEEGFADSKPLVRIGIVTRNRARVLPRAIESALSQGYRRTHVSVLDDGSDDETAALISQFPTVQWSHWKEKRGILEARNELMRTTHADYYLSLDDDAWFMGSHEIATAIQHFEANPGLGAIAFDILSTDRPRIRPQSKPYPVHTFVGCGHILRMSAVRESGYYASSPGFYGSEEKDLCIRLLDRGWEVHLMPGVHVWHDKTEMARDKFAQHCSGVCNDLVFAVRRCPLPIALIALPIKLLNQILFSLRHQLFTPCVYGICLFLRHPLELWTTRKPVRARTFREFIRRSRCRSQPTL